MFFAVKHNLSNNTPVFIFVEILVPGEINFQLFDRTIRRGMVCPPEDIAAVKKVVEEELKVRLLNGGRRTAPKEDGREPHRPHQESLRQKGRPQPILSHGSSSRLHF